MQEELIRDEDVAKRLSCGKSTVWRWAAEGVIPKPIKIGGATRWLRSEIEATISSAEANR